MDFLSIFFRLFFLGLVEILLFYTPKFFKLNEKSLFRLKHLLIFSVLISFFYFIYINFFLHNFAPRIEGDTISLVNLLYRDGKTYINAQGASLLTLFVINIFSCCLSPEATVTHFFNFIFPGLTFFLLFILLKTFFNVSISFYASILFIQIDLIINQFTLNVKQHLALLIIIFALIMVFQIKKRYYKKKYFDFLIGFLIIFFGLLVFFIHLVSYFASLLIIPILLCDFKIKDGKIMFNFNFSSIFWVIPVFFFPVIYGFNQTHLSILQKIFKQIPLINSIIEGINLYELVLFCLFVSFALIFFALPLIISLIIMFFFNNFDFFNKLRLKELSIPVILLCFVLYYLFVVPDYILILFYSDLDYILLSFPRFFLIALSLYFLLDWNFIKDLYESYKPQFVQSVNITQDFSFKYFSFIFLAFTLLLLFAISMLFDFLILRASGQWARRILDFFWFPLSVLMGFVIVHFKSVKKYENIVLIIFLLVTIPMFLLGSIDPFFMKEIAW